MSKDVNKNPWNMSAALVGLGAIGGLYSLFKGLRLQRLVQIDKDKLDEILKNPDGLDITSSESVRHAVSGLMAGWIQDGYEAYWLREQMGIEDPWKVPCDRNYLSLTIHAAWRHGWALAEMDAQLGRGPDGHHKGEVHSDKLWALLRELKKAREDLRREQTNRELTSEDLAGVTAERDHLREQLRAIQAALGQTSGGKEATPPCPEGYSYDHPRATGTSRSGGASAGGGRVVPPPRSTSTEPLEEGPSSDHQPDYSKVVNHLRRERRSFGAQPPFASESETSRPSVSASSGPLGQGPLHRLHHRRIDG